MKKTGDRCRWPRPAVLLATAFALVAPVAGRADVETDFVTATNAVSTNYFLGSVGIGTNNPASKLHVVGGATISGALSVPRQGDVSMGSYTSGVPAGGIYPASGFTVLGDVSIDASGTNTIPYWNGGLLTNASLLSWEPTSRTINLTTNDTTSEIQAKIDAVGRHIPRDVVITFQFADGTYSLTGPLTWEGFHGGGRIEIKGNTDEADATSLHTNQNVFLHFSGQYCDGIRLEDSTVAFTVRNLKIEILTTSTKKYCIYAESLSGRLLVRYNYLYGGDNGDDKNAGLYCIYVPCCDAMKNYVSNISRGIRADKESLLRSYDNDDVGTLPKYGLEACGGIILKDGATQPDGVSGDTREISAGQIFE